MSNCELPLTVFVSLLRGSEIPGALSPEWDKICVNRESVGHEKVKKKSASSARSA